MIICLMLNNFAWLDVFYIIFVCFAIIVIVICIYIDIVIVIIGIVIIIRLINL